MVQVAQTLSSRWALRPREGQEQWCGRRLDLPRVHLLSVTWAQTLTQSGDEVEGCERMHTRLKAPVSPPGPPTLSVFSAFLWAQVSLPCSLCFLLHSLQSVSFVSRSLLTMLLQNIHTRVCVCVYHTLFTICKNKLSDLTPTTILARLLVMMSLPQLSWGN